VQRKQLKTMLLIVVYTSWPAEILELHLPGTFERESWQLSHEEKAASIPSLQAKGNDLFSKGDISAAKATYFEALGRIEQLALREQPGSAEAIALENQKTPLLLNYALCLMKESELHEALIHLNSALTADPSNNTNKTQFKNKSSI